MVWAQAFPFVALQLYEGDDKDSITIFLIGSFSLWLALNVAFFCTIDLNYLNTFFGTFTEQAIRENDNKTRSEAAIIIASLLRSACRYRSTS